MQREALIVNDASGEFALVVQYPHRQGFLCHGFDSGFIAEPIYLVIEGARPEDQQDAANLGRELVQQLAALPSLRYLNKKESTCDSQLAGPKCRAIHNVKCRKYYVRLYSNTTSDQVGGSPNRFDQIVASRGSSGPWTVITAMAKSPPGQDLFRTMSEGFPKEATWEQLNAAIWDQEPTELIPFLMARIGLVSPAKRVFISYIRSETAALADQLFFSLTESGFEVFLDRCSVPKAVLFQEYLLQDLDDKAVVVLLYSQGVAAGKSVWVEKELSHVAAHRHGLLLVKVPNLSGGQPKVRVEINAQKIIDIQSGDLITGGVLTDQKLNEMIVEISNLHGQVIINRKVELFRAFGAAINRAKVKYRALPTGEFLVGSKNARVDFSPRSPELFDYRELSLRASLSQTGAIQTGAIVTPAPVISEDRRNSYNWLANIAGIEHVPESQIGEYLRRIS